MMKMQKIRAIFTYVIIAIMALCLWFWAQDQVEKSIKIEKAIEGNNE